MLFNLPARRIISCLLATSAIVSPVLSTPIAAAAAAAAATISPFQDVRLFQAPSNYTAPGTLYARSIQLPNGDFLTTWENYSPEPPMVYFPIYKSTDYGKTWSEFSRVQDQVRSMGLRYQPTLYILPAQLGNLPAGTILLAGSAIPTDLSSTHIELYASKDSGKTWSFVSHIADGGKAIPNNGETPVWEPFMLYTGGKLAVYYSDQRDPAHGQKMVHQTTTDGLKWSAVVNDVRYPDYNLRPGMPTVAHLANGSYIMTYELVNAPEGNAPVYYKLSNDPLSWDNKVGVPLIVNSSGLRPRNSPYVVVTDSGKVLVSGGQGVEIFVSDSNASLNGWRSVTPGQQRSYTRALTLVKQGASMGKQYVLVSGGGWFSDTASNGVHVGLDDFANW